MKVNFKKSHVMALLFPIAFIGCGGGGGSTSPTSPTYSVSGTVPGTIIEAYCTDGSYYTTSSTQNNTNEHPFILDIPQNSECRFVMITNEKDANGNPTPYTDWIITPISINLSTNLILDKDIELGYVPLETPGSTSYTGVGVKGVLNITNSNATVVSKSYDPLDIDGDGVPNVYEDDDNDGSYNKIDDDDDNNGIKDVAEVTSDHDGDGIDDVYDHDDDNDGIKDEEDDDYDNDGIKDSEDSDDYNNNTTTSIVLPATFTVNDGRLLASNCAQCHGTNGTSSNSWDSIKNEDDNIYHENFDDADELIMQAQADGYTLQEATIIRNWLNGL